MNTHNHCDKIFIYLFFNAFSLHSHFTKPCISFHFGRFHALIRSNWCECLTMNSEADIAMNSKSAVLLLYIAKDSRSCSLDKYLSRKHERIPLFHPLTKIVWWGQISEKIRIDLYPEIILSVIEYRLTCESALRTIPLCWSSSTCDRGSIGWGLS